MTQHLYAQLEYFLKAKNWEAADERTSRLMLNIAKREKEGYMDYNNIKSFSCPDLQRIDQLWFSNSDKRFSLSVQKEIWIRTGNRLGIKLDDWTGKDSENYLRFAKAVGWYDGEITEDSEKESSRNGSENNETGSLKNGFVTYDELIKRVKDKATKDKINSISRGGLPTLNVEYWWIESSLAWRLLNCNIR